MFTGIVEDIGTVTALQSGRESLVLTIQSTKVTEDIRLGDSIAVNGVCLTVVSFSENSFCVDVMPETVKATNIRTLQTGSSVNLERAMKMDGRFGGHFVSGHVDGTGKIVRKQREENAVYYYISLDQTLSRHCIPKGSITIDGISLTIFGLKPGQVTVSLIPHTYGQTVLGGKKEGDIVNIENDLLGKYVLSHMERKKPAMGLEFLEQHGF